MQSRRAFSFPELSWSGKYRLLKSDELFLNVNYVSRCCKREIKPIPVKEQFSPVTSEIIILNIGILCWVMGNLYMAAGMSSHVLPKT